MPLRKVHGIMQEEYSFRSGAVELCHLCFVERCMVAKSLSALQKAVYTYLQGSADTAGYTAGDTTYFASLLVDQQGHAGCLQMAVAGFALLHTL